MTSLCLSHLTCDVILQMVLSLAELPSGLLACGCSDNKINLLDREKQAVVKTLEGHSRVSPSDEI